MLSIGGVNVLYAQDTTSGPGTVEVTFSPGGWTYFRSANGGPNFGNYSLAGALTYNINAQSASKAKRSPRSGSQDLDGD